MPSEAILEQTDVDLAEGTLLLLRAPCALIEVPFSILVAECCPAVVRTLELAHVDQVVDVAGDLHLLKLPFAVGAETIPSKPLVETSAANESLAVSALGEVVQDICADGACELQQYFFEFRLCVVDAQFLELVSANSSSKFFVDLGDQLGCPLEGAGRTVRLVVVLSWLGHCFILGFYHFPTSLFALVYRGLLRMSLLRVVWFAIGA